MCFPVDLIFVAMCCYRRLPLCLNVAARVIAESGEEWESDVLPSLRLSVSDFVSDDSGLSPQQSLIETSLTAFDGRDAPSIKTLLLNSAIFGEVSTLAIVRACAARSGLLWYTIRAST